VYFVAVYTTLSESQVNECIARYNLPGLSAFQPVSAGIENTTYFLTLADNSQFVLTVFEMLSSTQLPPYLVFLSFLQKHDLPVPTPLADRQGNRLQMFLGKPAVLVPRAPGKHCGTPSLAQCASLGRVLAQFHRASVSFTEPLPNPCGLEWAEQSVEKLKPRLCADDLKLLHTLLEIGRRLHSSELPRGIIHGDLFRDNVLFEGDHVTGLIDFYNAGQDLLLLDLAIAVNDWACCYDQAAPHAERQAAIMEGYQSLRSLSSAEQALWPHALQWAATRFWLSRLNAMNRSHFDPAQAMKDPLEYKNLLIFHLKNTLK